MSKEFTHDQRLIAAGHSVTEVVRRIRATFEQATPGQIEAGANWYDDASKLVDDLSTLSGRSRETCAAVIAHLSPRTTWARNVTGATLLLTQDYAPHCMPANVERGRRAIGSDNPLGTVNGPKTRAFAANILGDTEAVTVDVWAGRVAFGPNADVESLLRKPGLYEAVAHCYRVAAAHDGVTPRTEQATTWIVARNGRAN
jgi:hypothetical protein